MSSLSCLANAIPSLLLASVYTNNGGGSQTSTLVKSASAAAAAVGSQSIAIQSITEPLYNLSNLNSATDINSSIAAIGVVSLGWVVHSYLGSLYKHSSRTDKTQPNATHPNTTQHSNSAIIDLANNLISNLKSKKEKSNRKRYVRTYFTYAGFTIRAVGLRNDFHNKHEFRQRLSATFQKLRRHSLQITESTLQKYCGGMFKSLTLTPICGVLDTIDEYSLLDLSDSESATLSTILNTPIIATDNDGNAYHSIKQIFTASSLSNDNCNTIDTSLDRYNHLITVSDSEIIAMLE